MLNEHQIKHLSTVPDNKIAHVVAFDPATQSTAREVQTEIMALLPSAQFFYIGSSALGIAGENDIDLTVIVEDFKHALTIFTDKYGKPQRTNLDDSYAHWEFERNGFPIELHLNDRMKPYFQEQLDTQKILEQNRDLRSEYEQLKLQCDGLPWKEYMRQKYEFWNRILQSSNQF